MFSSTMAPKWPILVSQCGMDHQKPTILLIFGTLSLGGCGGHPMRPKLNLKVKSQMSKPNEYTDNIKSNLTCKFLSVRTKLKNPFCPQTLCSGAEKSAESRARYDGFNGPECIPAVRIISHSVTPRLRVKKGSKFWQTILAWKFWLQRSLEKFQNLFNV